MSGKLACPGAALRAVAVVLVTSAGIAACGGDASGPQPGCPPDCGPAPDSLAGSWTVAPPLRQERREMPATTVDGRIVVTGGFGDDQIVMRSVEIHDPQTGAWTPGPDMPGPRHHHGIAQLDGTLYVIGGYSTLGSAWTPDWTVIQLDPPTGAWTFVTSMPQPRAAMGVAALNGAVYVFGGAAGGRAWSDTFVFDLATRAWRAAAPMPTAREHTVAAVLGSSVYVSGGRTFGGANMTTLEAYDVETDSWRTLQPMKRARSGHAMAAMGGRLYVFGGEDLLTGTVLNVAEEYDPATDTWRSVRQVPARLTGLAAVGVGDAIHIVGGSEPGGATRQHRIFRMPQSPGAGYD